MKLREVSLGKRGGGGRARDMGAGTKSVATGQDVKSIGEVCIQSGALHVTAICFAFYESCS